MTLNKENTERAPSLDEKTEIKMVYATCNHSKIQISVHTNRAQHPLTDLHYHLLSFVKGSSKVALLNTLTPRIISVCLYIYTNNVFGTYGKRYT